MHASGPAPRSPSRREFISSSGRAAGAGWLALHLPVLSSLAACSREAAERNAPFAVLSDGEADTMAAFAEVIVPSGDGPGAREAGVVHFVDGALDTLLPEMLEVIRPGIADLDERAGGGAPADGSAFAALPEDERVRVVREVETTPFFFTARMLVVMGMFGDPMHGGNRDGVGWELLGFEHAPAYEPPFGHYDAEAANASTGETP